MRFSKMHGAGNDYVYLDCFEQPIPDDLPDLAVQVSNRHFGIGADGLVLILPHRSVHSEMRMFNADGSEAEMCGNALRCVAWYLRRYGRTHHNPLTIATGQGALQCEVLEHTDTTGQVRIAMGKPRGESHLPPRAVLDSEFQIDGRSFAVSHVSMGNPHCVLFVPSVASAPVESLGPAIENDPSYPNRTNVGFAEVVSRNEIRLRVWERGSGETLACGTGACAAAVAAIENRLCDESIKVVLPGGELQIEWPDREGAVRMTGPVAEVFRGEWLESDSISSSSRP